MLHPNLPMDFVVEQTLVYNCVKRVGVPYKNHMALSHGTNGDLSISS